MANSRRVKETVRKFLPKTVKGHRILSGPLRGFPLVTSWHDYPAGIMGRTEHKLLRWFEHNVRPGETWLDVGAHYGYTAIALSRLVGNSGRVFAFEPMTATAGFLSQTRRLNGLSRLTVIPAALGSVDTFELKRLPTTRGMVDSTTAADDEFETFLVASLDWLWSRINEGSAVINGIKIDVQGMEYQVLRGMKKLLDGNRPKLAIEFHKGVDRAEILGLLRDSGYRDSEPIEPLEGETVSAYFDDRSYAFLPHV